MKFHKTLTMLLTALALMAATIQAEWTFDDDAKTFILDPALVDGDAFYQYWRGDASNPTTYIYSHDMSYQTASWYSPAWTNMRSFDGWTGTQAAADYRLLCQPNGLQSGGIAAVKTTNWFNSNDPSLALDHYFSYSTDDGAAYTKYFEILNWDLGDPAGTGFGNPIVKHDAQTYIDNPGPQTRLQYSLEQLDGWSEWYGSSFRVWGKSSQTEYHDNYITSPFKDELGNDLIQGGPFWQTSQVTWLSHNSGTLANNYSSAYTEVVYVIAHDGPIVGADIRLTSTDLADGAEAVWTPNANVKLHLAVATNPNGPWTDVYLADQFKANYHNPGAYVDFSTESPEVFFVKIYSDDGGTGNFYIRWGGFHVVLDTTLGDCAHVWHEGYGVASDVNQDCRVDLDDFALLAANWMECNDPQGDPACQAAWQ